MGIENEPGDFVVLIGDDRFGKEIRQWQVGKGELRRHALLGGRRGEAYKLVSAARGRGFGEEFAKIREGVSDAADGVRKRHAARIKSYQMGVVLPSIQFMLALLSGDNEA